MKLSKYFEIVKPTYVYIKLTPVNSVRNQSTDQIAKAICSLYRNLSQSIYKFEKKFFYETKSKVAYYIYVEKNKAEFYFVIPKTYLQLIKEKIQNSWKGITIIEVSEIPLFSKEATKYYLTYKKEDGLSLSVDKRANTLLGSILNIIPVMKEGDKVGIFYNFVPCNQLTWKSSYERTINKMKDGIPVDRQKLGNAYIFKMLFYAIVYVLEIVESAIFEATKLRKVNNSIATTFLNITELSIATNKKKDSIVVDTQILVLSKSIERSRENNNARAVALSFQRINEDNELTSKKIKPSLYERIRKRGIEFRPNDLYLPKVSKIKTSTHECQNFLQLPGRELLEEHNCIEKIETQETLVPDELQNGIMGIGTNTYRGKEIEAYLSNDSEFKNLTLCICGPTRAGKSTLIQNISKNAIDNGECVIIPDYISNNKLSKDIEKVIPKSKQLIIDCADLEKLEGLGFNETWGSAKTPLEKYDKTKEQTVQLNTLIDCINSSDKTLTAKMDRYLEAAANIVFLSYGPIGDVYKTIRDHKVRHYYINKVSEELLVYVSEYIDTLKEIDEYTTITEENEEDGTIQKVKVRKIIGSKVNLISGILDRFNRLKKNTAMELMLKKDCKNNTNLLKEIQKAQLITIKMSERRYKTSAEKDFLTTYWLTKLWQALQIRDYQIPDRSKRIKVNLIIDELYQVPQAQSLLKEKLSQMAKFDCKTIISCHYLGQIPIIRSELKSANSSYMLISGADKDNYRELKDELYPYTVEDILNLKRYHSLNLIRYENGYARFITQLPKPIK